MMDWGRGRGEERTKEKKVKGKKIREKDRNIYRERSACVCIIGEKIQNILCIRSNRVRSPTYGSAITTIHMMVSTFQNTLSLL